MSNAYSDASTQEKINANRLLLKIVADELPVPYQKLALLVIQDERFQQSPGGYSHHHNYRGGLIEHTREVVYNVQGLTGYNSQHYFEHYKELLLAAIWHDYHKIYEYGFEQKDDKECVTKLEYRTTIGHVVGSFVEFNNKARWIGIDEEMINIIGHIMLAHHGRLEWRSPVEPQTPEAFILHSADMLSARP